MQKRFRDLRDKNLQRSKAAGVAVGEEPSKPTPGLLDRTLKKPGLTEKERRRVLKLKRAALNGAQIVGVVPVRHAPGCFEMGRKR